MASPAFKHEFFIALVPTLSFQITSTGNPEIASDFVVPLNVTAVDGNFFTFTRVRALMSFDLPTAFKMTKESALEFPALNGQSVSMTILEYSAGSVNPPHTHPRASELLFLMHGSLEGRVIDMTNKLFTQTLQSGDMFVFPKGLVHYQYNANETDIAIAISAFGSASAGTVSLPASVFTTGIDSGILAKSFKTNVSTRGVKICQ